MSNASTSLRLDIKTRNALTTLRDIGGDETLSSLLERMITNEVAQLSDDDRLLFDMLLKKRNEHYKAH